jgi:1-acylglycerone phosphate reductase
MDLGKVRELFEVNLFGVMQMVQTFLPMLLASDDARIVQIGSITAVVPSPFSSAYNASKAGLAAYSDTLRIELAPFGYVLTVFSFPH